MRFLRPSAATPFTRNALYALVAVTFGLAASHWHSLQPVTPAFAQAGYVDVGFVSAGLSNNPASPAVQCDNINSSSSSSGGTDFLLGFCQNNRGKGCSGWHVEQYYLNPCTDYVCEANSPSADPSCPDANEHYLDCPASSASSSAPSCGPYCAGAQFGFFVTISNDGPDDAENAGATITLPAELEFVSGGGGAVTCTNAGNPSVVECHDGTLASGASLTIHLVLHATSPLSQTSQFINVVATTDSYDWNYWNNYSSPDVEVQTDPTCTASSSSSSSAVSSVASSSSIAPSSSSVAPSSSSAAPSSSSVASPPQCNDSLDNDGDGAIDYPSDFSCSGPSDNNEASPQSQCQDGADNDGDTFVDIDDPGCHQLNDINQPYDSQDNSETNPVSSASSSSSTTSKGGCGPVGREVPCSSSSSVAPPGYCPAAICPAGSPYPACPFGFTPSCTSGFVSQCYNGQPRCCDDVSCTALTCVATTTSCTTDFDCGFTACADIGGSMQACTSDAKHCVNNVCVAGAPAAQSCMACVCTDQCAVIGTDVYQCSDQIDNDADGMTDADDPGCWSDPYNPGSYNPSGNNELSADTECNDGIDNDQDGTVDSSDPGCWNDPNNIASPQYNPTISYENLGLTFCEDGYDNDGDGVMDAQDPGCDNFQDYTEDVAEPAGAHATPACGDGDNNNDGDSVSDASDPGCVNNGIYQPTDDNETNGLPFCGNGFDDDGDGFVDAGRMFGPFAGFNRDPSCATTAGSAEDTDRSPRGEAGAATYVDCKEIKGWFCDPDNGFGDSVNVLVYHGGAPGAGGTLLNGSGTPASEWSPDPTTQQHCGGNAGHGFSYSVPSSAAYTTPGTSHTYYVVGKNAGAQGSDVTVGFTMSCAQPHTYQCSDGVDNDNDGATDLVDNDCMDPYDDIEGPVPFCPANPGVCGQDDARILCIKAALSASSVALVSNPSGQGMDGTVGVANVTKTRAQLISAINNCGLAPLEPGNFTTPVIEHAIRMAMGNQPGGPSVFGPHNGSCSSDKSLYEAAGVLISKDDNCDEPYLMYKFNERASSSASYEGDTVVAGEMIRGIADSQSGTSEEKGVRVVAGWMCMPCNGPGDVPAQCGDGVDNDGDSLTDSQDQGCFNNGSYTPQDDDESDATSQCADGSDDDGDGLVDSADPGCWDDVNDPGTYNESLNDEAAANAQCSDGLDNDDDGLKDAMDPGCDGPTDYTEDVNEVYPGSLDEQRQMAMPQCSNGGIDDDGDGVADNDDEGCRQYGLYEPTDNAEEDKQPQCSDGLDNDGDGLVDTGHPWGNPPGFDADFACVDQPDFDNEGEDHHPRGQLSAGSTCTTLYGWACDPDAWDATVTVIISTESPTGMGTEKMIARGPLSELLKKDVALAQDAPPGPTIGKVDAGDVDPNGTTIPIYCGGTERHAFTFEVPQEYTSVGEHTYYVTFKNVGEGDDWSYPQPVTVTCAAPAVHVCNNNADDDGDGDVDYPNDAGCASAYDDNEWDPICPNGNYSSAGGFNNTSLFGQQNFANQAAASSSSSGAKSIVATPAHFTSSKEPGGGKDPKKGSSSEKGKKKSSSFKKK